MARINTGGGGGSGGTTDTTDTTATATISNLGGTATIEIDLPRWVVALRPLVLLVQNPRAWVVAAIVGIPLSEALFRLNVLNESAAEIIVEDYLFRQIVLPLAVTVFNLGVSAVNAIVGFFEVLASLPGRGAAPVINAFVGLGFVLFTAVDTLNRIVAGGLEPFGLTAPVVVPALFAFELALLAYLAWLAIQTLDLLTLGVIDDAIDIGRAATWPFWRVVGWFR